MGGIFQSLFGGAPKITIPPLPSAPPSANPPSLANAGVGQAGFDQRAAARMAAGAGFADTLRNQGGSGGLNTKAAPTAAKTLLG